MWGWHELACMYVCRKCMCEWEGKRKKARTITAIREKQEVEASRVLLDFNMPLADSVLQLGQEY